MASAGVEAVAEQGNTATFESEIKANMNAVAVIEKSLPSGGTPTATVDFTVTTAHPRVTLLTMIAPSPDWFVGVSGLSLLDAQGDWLASHSADLFPYDAGTEEGTGFSLSNAATSPQGTITSINGELNRDLPLFAVPGAAVAADEAVENTAASTIDAGDLTIAVNGQGRITALTGSDARAAYLGYTPALLKLIVADSPEAAAGTARQLLPTAALLSASGTYTLSYDHGILASVALVENAGYASLELTGLAQTGSDNKDIRAAMWGPYEVTIDEQVADVAGVAYSRDFAIGIQAANEKTFGGAPYEFTDNDYVSAFDHSADAYEHTRTQEPQRAERLLAERGAPDLVRLGAAGLLAGLFARPDGENRGVPQPGKRPERVACQQVCEEARGRPSAVCPARGERFENRPVRAATAGA